MNTEQTKMDDRLPAMLENKREILHKEIDLLQSVINRMAHNSFLVKGWSLAILTFSVGFSTHVSVGVLALVLLVPVMALWWLDSYYLRLERAYRRRYEKVLKKRCAGDWANVYDLNCEDELKGESSVLRIMFSSSTLPFHGVLFGLLMLVGLWQVHPCDRFKKEISYHRSNVSCQTNAETKR